MELLHGGRHGVRPGQERGPERGGEILSRQAGAPVGKSADCSSAAEVALLDAGELTDIRRAAVRAHVRSCYRCERSLDEIRQARKELLGDTPKSSSILSIGAAVEIQRVLHLR